LTIELWIVGALSALCKLQSDGAPRPGDVVMVDTSGSVARYRVSSVEWRYYRAAPHCGRGNFLEGVLVWLVDVGQADAKANLELLIDCQVDVAAVESCRRMSADIQRMLVGFVAESGHGRKPGGQDGL
jgi:hypothetical protein